MKKLLILMIGLIGFATVAAVDTDPNTLRKLAERTAQLVDRNADQLTRSEREEVRILLNDINRIVRGGGNNPGDYESSTQLGPLSRKSGGELMYAVLRTPVVLSSLSVTPSGNQVRIYEATAITDRNMVLRLDDLTSAGIISNGQTVYAYPPSGDRIREVRLKMEAWGSNTYLRVTGTSEDSRIDFGDGGGGGGRPGRGYFCSAACSNANNLPDLRYSRGAEGQFELEAQQLAVEAVRRSYNCGRGIVPVNCSVIDDNTYAAISACTASNGNADLRYARLAKGVKSLEGARQASREEVAKSYNCGTGITTYKSDDANKSGPRYCTAACAASNGTPDLRYSKGASGQSEVEAMGLAIQEVQKSYNCGVGIVIDKCSR